MQWVFLKDPAVSTCDMHPQNLLESFQQLLSSSTYLTPFNGTSHATTPPPTSQNSGTETLDRRIGTFSCESQGCKRRQKHSPNSPLAQPNSPSQKACQMLSSAWFLDIPRPLILPIHLSLSLWPPSPWLRLPAARSARGSFAPLPCGSEELRRSLFSFAETGIVPMAVQGGRLAVHVSGKALVGNVTNRELA